MLYESETNDLQLSVCYSLQCFYHCTAMATHPSSYCAIHGASLQGSSYLLKNYYCSSVWQCQHLLQMPANSSLRPDAYSPCPGFIVNFLI